MNGRFCDSGRGYRIRIGLQELRTVLPVGILQQIHGVLAQLFLRKGDGNLCEACRSLQKNALGLFLAFCRLCRRRSQFIATDDDMIRLVWGHRVTGCPDLIDRSLQSAKRIIIDGRRHHMISLDFSILDIDIRNIGSRIGNSSDRGSCDRSRLNRRRYRTGRSLRLWTWRRVNVAAFSGGGALLIDCSTRHDGDKKEKKNTAFHAMRIPCSVQ